MIVVCAANSIARKDGFIDKKQKIPVRVSDVFSQASEATTVSNSLVADLFSLSISSKLIDGRQRNSDVKYVQRKPLLSAGH